MGAAEEFVEDNFIRATRHSNQARVIAARVGPLLCQKHPELFQKVPRVTAVSNQGWLNFTMAVHCPDSNAGYILRLRSKTSARERASRSVPQFDKEHYVLGHLAHLGYAPLVPQGAIGTISLDATGNGDSEFGYIIQTFLPYEAARRDLGTEDRAKCLRQLGEKLRAVHSIEVAGFGTDFDQTRQSFGLSSWKEMIERRISDLESSSVDASLKRWLSARMTQLSTLNTKPTIFHQDLLANWGNFLVDDERAIRGIIDWEFSGSGLAFHNEIASFLYAQTRDGIDPTRTERDLSHILEGYGISEAEYKHTYAYDIETLVLLHAVSALEKLAVLKRNGGLSKEPWRQTFAERAQRLCERRAV